MMKICHQTSKCRTEGTDIRSFIDPFGEYYKTI
jgi:hypothetical protein